MTAADAVPRPVPRSETTAVPSMSLGAIITAFHPDGALLDIVRAAARCCDSVVVVDNTPVGLRSTSDQLREPYVVVLRPGANGGLAAALNAGIRSLEPSISAVLLLDQDSMVETTMIRGLAEGLITTGAAAVGPLLVDAQTGKSYERPRNGDAHVGERDALMTSGMLLRRSAIDQVGDFREDFFVDWVDNDFCLRLRRQGLRILLDRRHRMAHSVGAVRIHRMIGRRVRVLHYPAWRHYWICRNAVVLCREHFRVRPRWVAHCAMYVGRQALTAAVFDRSWSVVQASLRGLRDGATGRASVRYLPEGSEYRPSRAGSA